VTLALRSSCCCLCGKGWRHPVRLQPSHIGGAELQAMLRAMLHLGYTNFPPGREHSLNNNQVSLKFAILHSSQKNLNASLLPLTHRTIIQLNRCSVYCNLLTLCYQGALNQEIYVFFFTWLPDSYVSIALFSFFCFCFGFIHSFYSCMHDCVYVFV